MNASHDRAISNALRAEQDLEALWLPFTHNRLFKRDPRLVVEASGMMPSSRKTWAEVTRPKPSSKP